MTTKRPSSLSLSAPSAEQEGTQTHSHALREHCGVPSPNAPAAGQPKGHIQPTAGFLPRRVRGVRIVPQPILELVRMHPHLNLDEFHSGAGFFVPAKRSRRRLPVRSCTLNERRGVSLFIPFAPPNVGGQPKGHLQPTVGNLPRRRRATVGSYVQPAQVVAAAVVPDETRSKSFNFVSGVVA
ncbi:hypothetical protein C0992_004283 [Termitomyces sp. T32_za158]|nr:hypothetical protein C0992_004283 [Termitomyces sp. T32_za158]